MYKVYFAVYLSSQKCDYFRNIRRFFEILFANQNLLLPSRAPTSFAMLTSPPRKYVRIMQPILQHARTFFENTASPSEYIPLQTLM